MRGVRRPRLWLVLCCGLGLVLVAVVAFVARDDAPPIAEQPTATYPSVEQAPTTPASPPESASSTDATTATPAVWSRPVTRDADDFVRAFARAIWTYDTDIPYRRWTETIAGWADPLGSPASPRVARAMLPPAPAYAGLRSQSAVATATVTDVVVPDAAVELVSQAPTGWHAFVVRGQQRVTTDRGAYLARRQVSVATVCDPTCWLWSATTKVAE